eukprot:1561005-Pyramimonas_sp.AAC.1
MFTDKQIAFHQASRACYLFADRRQEYTGPHAQRSRRPAAGKMRSGRHDREPLTNCLSRSPS